MMKIELINKLKDLINQESLLNLGNEFKEVTDQFFKIIKEEEHAFEVDKLNRIESGENPDSIIFPIDQLNDDFKNLISEFKEKRKAESDAIKAIEEQNLLIKKDLIKSLKDLVQNEENIGKAISSIKEIQVKWKDVGPIPRTNRQSIQKDYSSLMDDFQYNINIYKEIKDHDLSKNAKLKKSVLEELITLKAEKNIKIIETKLHKIQDEWNEIGGTSKEVWESLKESYWTTVNELYSKIRDFYDSRREEQKENLIKKLAIIDKLDEAIQVECLNQNDWKTVTDKVIAIQNEWKTIGFAPKKENDIVWKGFRAKCDLFFDAKNEFFKDINSAFDKIKDAKQKLIEKVEGIKESTNWNDTTKAIVTIQNDWKRLGSAGQRNENKLWRNFRKPIDFFFSQKDAFYETLDKNNEGNLTLKEALIKKVEDFKLSDDPKVAISELKHFSKEFNAIGNVPFKQKDHIYKAYKTAIDIKFSEIKLDKKEKDSLLYNAKIEGIYNSPNMERELDKENAFLRKKIDESIKERAQVENNLSFFSGADDNNPLLKNVKENIEKFNIEISDLKNKLQLLNNFDLESE